MRLPSWICAALLSWMPVAEALAGDLDAAISAPGRVEGASDIISIGTAATGLMTEVLVKEGERVAKGQTLIQVDCRAIEAEVRQKEAEAIGSDVALSRIRTGARDEEVAIAMAAVTASEARADEAERAFQRLTALQQGVASRARLGELERDSKVAGALLLDARMRLRMLQAGARGEDVIEAEAKRAAALAAVDSAKARRDDCTVRAPVGGTILVANTAPGQFVASLSLVPVMKMVDDSLLRVRAEIDERDFGRLCPGQRATVLPEGAEGLAGTGAVVSQVSSVIGRRAALAADRPDKPDRDIREVLLTLDPTTAPPPIGLRVRVALRPCPARAEATR